MSERPSDAPEACPGTSSEQAGRAAACEGCPNQATCSTAPKGPDPDEEAVAQRLAGVKHKVLVLSGKGGVGKSTVAAQLSLALAGREREVGLLDVDICGPSMPRMLGLEGEEVHQSGAGWSPVYVQDNLGVMSIGFMLPNKDDAVVWRGPRKNALIKQFVKDVDWGELDFLIVDAPPGTSDEHISIAQLLKQAGIDGAIIVTTPQEVALIDVRKEINFCRKVGIKVLGVVENMSELSVPLTGLRFEGKDGADRTAEVLQALRAAIPDADSIMGAAQIFHKEGSGAEEMARAMGVPFIGRLPMDPTLGRAAEEGRGALESGSGVACAPAVDRLVAALLASLGEKES
mmetsp:Transcript_15787/g.51750  ORF Transcript_15787/g.51750 Transcript_15787/m.51750 type:complete len:345 (+) Transcript_15787:3-1037(+)